jgi:hypothetical protein
MIQVLQAAWAAVRHCVFNTMWHILLLSRQFIEITCEAAQVRGLRCQGRVAFMKDADLAVLPGTSQHACSGWQRCHWLSRQQAAPKFRFQVRT